MGQKKLLPPFPRLPSFRDMATGNRKTVRGKRIADIQRVENRRAHPAAAKEYNHLRGQTEDGSELDFLFTDAEWKRARRRAERNPEDCPKASFLRNIFD